jgi:FtsH-binding integral membrane protein
MKEQVYSLQSAADSSLAERSAFIRRTYLHVAGAIAAFALLEAWLISSGLGEAFVSILANTPMSWLLVMGLFIGTSFVADKFAHSETSEGMQYFGLGLFTVAEAIVFLPIIYTANEYFPGAIAMAGYITALLVIGLTATVFISKKDFSFLGSLLKIGFLIGFGVIICSIIFGFTLGLVFSGAMALLAAGAVLYTTSNILHQYHTGQHVAAALALFSSIALLFFYVLRIVMSFTGRD